MRLLLACPSIALLLLVATHAPAQEADAVEESPAAEAPAETAEGDAATSDSQPAATNEAAEGTAEPSPEGSAAEADQPATAEEQPAEAAEAAETSGEPEAEADQPPATDDPATDDPPANESAPVEEAPATEPPTTEEPSADAAEADTPEEDAAEDAATAEEDAAEDEAAEDEAAEADADEADADEEAPAGTDWAGLAERAPAFLALMHHAAVHLPIALWIFGAVFVVIGVVVPSLRTQIPLASLLFGTITSVAATATGWWYAEHVYGDMWTWGDELGDFSEHLVKHRWTAVALLFVSTVLSILAVVNQAKKSKTLGVIWRLGLIGLALAVAWEGHIGGEIIHGEGFLEDAYQEWVNPEG
ncbi:hypothetical protein [Botrimarina sp.]|uniref:hypothetical protein n=1 Tax=Botrimarina sp. TaxID=2795802 RepID=UPI0032F08071